MGSCARRGCRRSPWTARRTGADNVSLASPRDRAVGPQGDHGMTFRSSRCIRLGFQFGRAAAVLVVLGVLTTPASPQNDARSKQATTRDGAAKKDQTKPAPVKLGLHLNDPRAFQGYTLLAPFDSPNTYLLDMQGKVVQTWTSDCTPALFPMLLVNGNLLRPGHIGSDSSVFGSHPGIGGRVQEIGWDRALGWDLQLYKP